METKHTPGPWKLKDESFQWQPIYAKNGTHILTMPNMTDQDKANAELIAQAPETLAKYEEAKTELETLRLDIVERDLMLQEAIELLSDSQACIDFGTNAYRENEKFLSRYQEQTTKV